MLATLALKFDARIGHDQFVAAERTKTDLCVIKAKTCQRSHPLKQLLGIDLWGYGGLTESGKLPAATF